MDRFKKIIQSNINFLNGNMSKYSNLNEISLHKVPPIRGRAITNSTFTLRGLRKLGKQFRYSRGPSDLPGGARGPYGRPRFGDFATNYSGDIQDLLDALKLLYPRGYPQSVQDLVDALRQALQRGGKAHVREDGSVLVEQPTGSGNYFLLRNEPPYGLESPIQGLDPQWGPADPYPQNLTDNLGRNILGLMLPIGAGLASEIGTDEVEAEEIPSDLPPGFDPNFGDILPDTPPNDSTRAPWHWRA